jgi:hypothetical protein
MPGAENSHKYIVIYTMVIRDFGPILYTGLVLQYVNRADFSSQCSEIRDELDI